MPYRKLNRPLTQEVRDLLQKIFGTFSYTTDAPDKSHDYIFFNVFKGQDLVMEVTVKRYVGTTKCRVKGNYIVDAVIRGKICTWVQSLL